MLPRPCLAAAYALLVASAASGRAPAAPPAAGTEPPPLRSASPPSALERARVERWHRAWREEAGAVERGFAAALAAVEAQDGQAFRRSCLELAGALLGLERARVLPVPDRAVDLHVRRALRHLARASLTCLTDRPYAARHAFEQAADAFGSARRILRRYGPAAGRPEPVPTPPRPGLAPPLHRSRVVGGTGDKEEP